MLVRVSNTMFNILFKKNYLLGAFQGKSASEFKAMNPVIDLKKLNKDTVHERKEK